MVCRSATASSDTGLAHFQSAYPSEKISKEDLFYFVYGILHSADYRNRYADNLGKELPRIPRVKKAEDFWRSAAPAVPWANCMSAMSAWPWFPTASKVQPTHRRTASRREDALR